MRNDGERGVRAVQPFKSRSFVCEFEGNLLSKAECEQAEKEYEAEGKRVYILEVPTLILLICGSVTLTESLICVTLIILITFTGTWHMDRSNPSAKCHTLTMPREEPT